MPHESLTRRRERAIQLLERLEAHLPGAKIELDYQTPLELLVAVILSAQCTDKRVNLVTPALFARFPDAGSYAAVSAQEIEPYIASCGLFRNKAKSIQAASRAILERHGGEVPVRRAELESLPGVGSKTAGVVSIHLGGDSAFPVDTHVFRLARRLGLSEGTAPDAVERDLCALIPEPRWATGHQLLIWHGRRTCFARAPECDRCPIETLCPKKGLTAPRRPALPRGQP